MKITRIMTSKILDSAVSRPRCTSAGTDAVHTDPDYSAAYVILQTDGGLEGHGFTFTIGRGNEVCAAAIRAFAPLVVGQRRSTTSPRDPAAFWRTLAGDSQLRWLGPEKGVIHISMAAIVNAVWDLQAKARGQAGVEAARRHDAARDRRAASTSATSPTR